MRKFILLIMPAGLLFLTSCGKSEKAIETYVSAENFTIYEATSLPASMMISENMQTKITSTESRNMSYILNGTDISLLVDGKAVQTISLTYIPDTSQIVIDDFNFDGYDDIFIPYENYGIVYGEYYCYIPVENSFTRNSELAKIGRILTVESDGILSERQDDEYTDRVVEYKWTDGKLNAFRKTETYCLYDDGQLHTNIYGYTEDGSEYLENSY